MSFTLVDEGSHIVDKGLCSNISVKQTVLHTVWSSSREQQEHINLT